MQNYESQKSAFLKGLLDTPVKQASRLELIGITFHMAKGLG